MKPAGDLLTPRAGRRRFPDTLRGWSGALEIHLLDHGHDMDWPVMTLREYKGQCFTCGGGLRIRQGRGGRVKVSYGPAGLIRPWPFRGFRRCPGRRRR